MDPDEHELMERSEDFNGEIIDQDQIHLVVQSRQECSCEADLAEIS